MLNLPWDLTITLKNYKPVSHNRFLIKIGRLNYIDKKKWKKRTMFDCYRTGDWFLLFYMHRTEKCFCLKDTVKIQISIRLTSWLIIIFIKKIVEDVCSSLKPLQPTALPHFYNILVSVILVCFCVYLYIIFLTCTSFSSNLFVSE